MHECNEMGTVISEDQFEILEIENADWPLTAYELLQPKTEFECKKSCLHDCYCAVAIFQDPKYNNGTGRCWKKRLLLSNGRYNRHAIDRKALFKILKLNSSFTESYKSRSRPRKARSSNINSCSPPRYFCIF